MCVFMLRCPGHHYCTNILRLICLEHLLGLRHTRKTQSGSRRVRCVVADFRGINYPSTNTDPIQLTRHGTARHEHEETRHRSCTLALLAPSLEHHGRFTSPLRQREHAVLRTCAAVLANATFSSTDSPRMPRKDCVLYALCSGPRCLRNVHCQQAASKTR